MAKDLTDHARDALQHVVKEAVKNIGDATTGKGSGKNGGLSGARGVAAGAGLAALAPLAKKGYDAVRSNGGPSLPSPKPGKVAAKAASKVGDRVGDKVKDGVSQKVDEAGGAGGLAKKAAGGLLPGGDSDSGGGGKNSMPGVGQGRRMPVQQSVDVAVPIETAYNQWTQYEDWTEFMHRITRVSQDDPCTVNFQAKIWTRTRDFEAEIITQRPDERIKWQVAQGITHTGVVTFHELAPRLTRIEINMDVEPGGMIEKAARGMRHVKRAVRADLHRFKAFIEIQEQETGAWRGVIEDGELVEDHDPSYDEEREYSDRDALFAEDADEDQDEEQDEDEDEDDDSRSQRARSSQAQRSRSRSSSSSSRRGSGSGSSSKSASSSKSGSSRRQTRSRGSSNGSKASSSGGSKRSKSSGGSSRSRSSSSKRKTSSRS
jgi:uncharacterized membrane protein